LHRLASLKKVELNKTKSLNSNQELLSELVLRFETDKDTTLFVVGGIDISKPPVLTVEDETTTTDGKTMRRLQKQTN
jgi:uncharacterized protein YbaP (TraB family)